MLIIPFDRGIDWKRPPVVTILLVIINLAIYFGIQTKDDLYEQDARTWYFRSELPKYEFEPYYDYLKQQGRDDELNEFRKVKDKWTGEGRLWTYYKLNRDPGFQELLENGQIVKPGTDEYRDWFDKREKYKNLISKSVTNKYVLIPAKSDPVTYLTCTFLHGSVSHVISNMVFLMLVGFVVETVLGSRLYLLFYLLTGLGGSFAYVLTNLGGLTATLGASGAVSGVIGMYMAIFRLRKIRFFWNFLFYFDTFKAPAILVLPVVIINELVMYFLNEGMGVAYFAHVGGFVTGGILGLLVSKSERLTDQEYLDKNDEEEAFARLLDEATRLMGQLEFEKARDILYTLLEEKPDDTDLLGRLFSIEKLTPENDRLHKLVARILDLPASLVMNRKLMRRVFAEYVKATNNKLRLKPQTLLKHAICLLRDHHVVEAEKLVNVLLTASPDLEGMSHALLTLSNGYRGDDDDKARYYLNLLKTNYPYSNEAKLIQG